MAVYYVRQTGNDSNDGLSPSSAWRTIQRCVNAGAITSGDIVYVGAGTYREAITVNITSPTSEVQLIGDEDGVFTGDSGEVIITTASNEEAAPSGSYPLINSRSYFTYKNITFSGILAFSSSGVNYIRFENCRFLYIYTSSPGSLISTNSGIFNVINFYRCTFISLGGNTLRLQSATSATNPYSSNIVCDECLFIGNSSINLTNTSTQEFGGSGPKFYNCTLILSEGLNLANSYRTYKVDPVVCNNCLFIANAAIIGREVGNVIENFNFFNSFNARSNVSIGSNSINNQPVYLEVGHSDYLDISINRNQYMFAPDYNSRANFIGDHLLNRSPNSFQNLPLGGMTLLYEGYVSGYTNNTLIDNSKVFPFSSGLRGFTVHIIEGPGRDETKYIHSSSGSTLNCGGKWLNQLTNQSKYIVYPGPRTQISEVTSGTISTLVDSDARWHNNCWAGSMMKVVSGAASGANFLVSGNSFNTLTGSWQLSKIPQSGDIYELFWGFQYESRVKSATANSITDDNPNISLSIGTNWPTGFYWANGYRLIICDGSGVGANFAISGNNSNTFSGFNESPLSVVPASGDKFVVIPNNFKIANLTGYYPSGYYPDYSRFIVPEPVGCFNREKFNTAIISTDILFSGNNSLRLFGPSCQKFSVPVSGGVNNSINVYGYFDKYYSGIKPQLIVDSYTGLSISSLTGTMTGPSEQWEKISLDLNPSANGIVNIKFQSNTSGLYGSAYFNGFHVI